MPGEHSMQYGIVEHPSQGKPEDLVEVSWCQSFDYVIGAYQ